MDKFSNRLFTSNSIRLEPAEKDIMNRKPIDSRKGIFSDGLWSKIIIEGIMIGMLTLISFSIETNIIA